MLAIFQIPNKFYEKDGRVTDPPARSGTKSGEHRQGLKPRFQHVGARC